jgi:hypothetical protein
VAPSLVFRWKWVVLRSDLASGTKCVLLVIGMHMSPTGRDAFPSVARIAKLASLSRSTVSRHLRLAEEAGYLRRVRRWNASSVFRPTAPGWKEKSENPASTIGEKSRIPEGVVAPAGFHPSENPSSTSPFTNPPTNAVASASSPEVGSQPLRQDGNWVCPMCGVGVIPRRGTCGYCTHSWAEDESTPKRQDGVGHSGATSGSLIPDLTAAEQRRVGAGRREVDA